MKNAITLLFLGFFLVSCDTSNQVQRIELDGFSFYMPTDFILSQQANDENVLLTLDKPKGNAIIIQNDISILRKVYLKNLNSKESLKALHQLKFDSYIQDMGGYEVGEITLNKIGNIPFSMQTFKYNESDFEVSYDVRVISIKGRYYPIYSFGTSQQEVELIQVIDDLILSLSTENLIK